MFQYVKHESVPICALRSKKKMFLFLLGFCWAVIYFHILTFMHIYTKNGLSWNVRKFSYWVVDDELSLKRLLSALSFSQNSWMKMMQHNYFWMIIHFACFFHLPPIRLRVNFPWHKIYRIKWKNIVAVDVSDEVL